MSTTTTTIVSIGGKVGQRHLAPRTWAAFRLDTLAAVRASLTGDGQVVFTGTGTGRWVDGAGHVEVEPSFTVIASGGIDRAALDAALARLAARYHQEAIAVTTGTASFVAAASPVAA